MRFRFVGNHVQDLPGGKTLEPGEFMDLVEGEFDKLAEHVRALIIPVDPPVPVVTTGQSVVAMAGTAGAAVDGVTTPEEIAITQDGGST